MEDLEPSPSRNSVTDIPLDLTLEILSKLSAKSLIRFESVSKLWFSLTRSKDFTNLFLTRSRTRPRLLITSCHDYSQKRFIYSAPEHEDNDKSSTVIASHEMTVSNKKYYFCFSHPINGFMCFTSNDSSIFVFNPTTKQTVELPYAERKGRDMYACFGYDPVEDQYKVLCVMIFNPRTGGNIEQEHFVCTVRSGQNQEWRMIQTIKGDPYNFIKDGEICIGGTIYYIGGCTRVARFDVRLERIDFIQLPQDFEPGSCYSTVVNYQGKLAGVSYDESKIRLWILEDAEKQEWSSIMKTCDVPGWLGYMCVGGIDNKEIMMASSWLESSKLFSVYYYDLTIESIRRVEVDGISNSEFRRILGNGKYNVDVQCFPGYVENITFL